MTRGVKTSTYTFLVPRASCDQGELCRDGFCTVVYLKVDFDLKCLKEMFWKSITAIEFLLIL